MHLDIHALQLILLESAKASEGPPEARKLLEPHHTHP